MKVDQQSQLHIIDFYHGKTAVTEAANGTPGPSDIIEISPAGREIDALKKSVAALPEMRLERVALMKQELGFGTYRVDAELVAAKMMESYGTGGWA
ncbi:flagellar biosynthesis anti-sigma factor FlgM [Geotalea sp. SG265]|uniref:flagellar biosynthesis anti-sigma factor FlgM n=1 Tax=Geotalea sp. SG265 TaxID=2922867 RepID=UPI001FAFE368